MSRPSAVGREWLVLCVLHGVASMLAWWALAPSVEVLVWRVDDWTERLWTVWSTAWVHVNTPQLIANQTALGMLAAFSWRARPDRWCALAWLLAWPLTYLGVALWPQVGYVVGLSGLLHAAVAVLAVHLWWQRLPVPLARRWGALLALVLVGKLWLDGVWSRPIAWDSVNNMSVVQAAWFSGAVCGALLGTLTVWLARRWERAAAQ